MKLQHFALSFLTFCIIGCCNTIEQTSTVEMQKQINVLKANLTTLIEGMEESTLDNMPAYEEAGPFNKENMSTISDFVKLWWCSSSRERMDMIQRRNSTDGSEALARIILMWNYRLAEKDFSGSVDIATELFEKRNQEDGLWTAMLVLEVHSFCERFKELMDIVFAQSLDMAYPADQIEADLSPYKRNVFLGSVLLMLLVDRGKFSILPGENVRIDYLGLRPKHSGDKIPFMAQLDIDGTLSKGNKVTNLDIVSLWNSEKYEMLMKVCRERIAADKEDLSALYVLMATGLMIDDTELLEKTGEEALNLMNRYLDVRETKAWRELMRDLDRYMIGSNLGEGERRVFRTWLKRDSTFEKNLTYLEEIQEEYDPTSESEVEKLYP